MNKISNKILERAEFADKFGNYRLSDVFYSNAVRLAASGKKSVMEVFGDLLRRKGRKVLKPGGLKDLLKDELIEVDAISGKTKINISELDRICNERDIEPVVKSNFYAKISAAGADENKIKQAADMIAKELEDEAMLELKDRNLRQKVKDFFATASPKELAVVTGTIPVGGTLIGVVANYLKGTPDSPAAPGGTSPETSPETSPGTSGGTSGGSGGSSGGSSGAGSIKGDPDRYKGPGGMYRERMDKGQQQAKNEEALAFIQANKEDKKLKFQRDWRNKAILFYAKKMNKSFGDKEVVNFANDVSALIKKDMPELLKEAPVVKETTSDEFDVPAPTEDKNPADTNNEPKINV